MTSFGLKSIWKQFRACLVFFLLSAAAFNTQAYSCSALCSRIRPVLELVLFSWQPRELRPSPTSSLPKSVLVIQDGNNRREGQLAFSPLAEATSVHQLMFLSTCLVFAWSVTCCLKELQLGLSTDTLALNLPAERGTCLFFFPFYYK